MDWSGENKSRDSFEWDVEDEDEVQSKPFLFSSSSDVKGPGEEASISYDKPSTSTRSCFSLISHFVGMGFSKNMVTQAIKENGVEDEESILETLLTYSVVETSSPKCLLISSETSSSGSKMDPDYRLLDSDCCYGYKETIEDLLVDKEEKLLHLVEMGYLIDDASLALEKCGQHASITELLDFISTSEIEKITTDAPPQESPNPSLNENELGPSHFPGDHPPHNKRKLFEVEEIWEKKMESLRKRRKESYKKGKKPVLKEEETIHVPKLMIGFGVPKMLNPMVDRKIPLEAIGPPYFYFENVAYAPKGAWDTMSRFLCEIKPEFVDSVYFCAAARKRGYIHNLPIHNRFPLQPIPPLTIQEAFPYTKNWWPSWDKRTKFNCLKSTTGSGGAKVTERIRQALQSWDAEEPPLRTQKYILYECKNWNLVWVGKNKVASLDPEEIEMVMGYPKHHTRGGGTSITNRFKALGNSFQVDTVAFHLSVLKNLFPNGISVLSLFSGIGGAEVALHRLGIPLKNVVSVEISKVNRNIIQSWWEQTNQKGNLIHIADVQELNLDRLGELMKSLGGFDLIIGGSPCNKLSGYNRLSGDGRNGEHSILFFNYFRILNDVKLLMGKA